MKGEMKSLAHIKARKKNPKNKTNKKTNKILCKDCAYIS